MLYRSANADLIRAFPSAWHEAARDAVARFPEPAQVAETAIGFRVGNEDVEIPERLFHDAARVDLEGLESGAQRLASALLTRHVDVSVRLDHLARIVSWPELWVPPFVAQLASEPESVVLELIWTHRTNLKSYLYAEFLAANPEFWEKAKQQLNGRGDHYGLRLIDHFDTLLCSGR